MRWMVLATIMAVATACAGNQSKDEQGTRVRDTALTVEDSLNPSDTLDRARRVVPDSSVGLDTTSAR
jgi:hypothetical protein